MTNFEKHKEEIFNLLEKEFFGKTIAVKNDNPVLCNHIPCEECDFYDNPGEDCLNDFMEWLCKDNNESMCKFCKYRSVSEEDYPCSICSQIYENRFEKIPKKTRQDKFLEVFSNTPKTAGIIDVLPCETKGFLSSEKDIEECRRTSCLTCKEKYWLEEIEE